MDNQKSSTNIILAFIGVALLGTLIYFMFIKKTEPIAEPTPSAQVEDITPIIPVETEVVTEDDPIISTPKLPDTGISPR